MTGPVGIWERKRRAVRAELCEVALELLTNRDFESVTVDEIAAAMHPRSSDLPGGRAAQRLQLPSRSRTRTQALRLSFNLRKLTNLISGKIAELKLHRRPRSTHNRLIAFRARSYRFPVWPCRGLLSRSRLHAAYGSATPCLYLRMLALISSEVGTRTL
jgi:hypothetical protein